MSSLARLVWAHARRLVSPTAARRLARALVVRFRDMAAFLYGKMYTMCWLGWWL